MISTQSYVHFSEFDPYIANNKIIYFPTKILMEIQLSNLEAKSLYIKNILRKM